MKQSNTKSTENYVVPKIDKIFELQDTIPTVCSPKFKEQVEFLCRKIYNLEWSGILFYNVVGEFPNIEKITLEEIFLMDKGTTGFTSYSFDHEVVEFIMDNPHLENYKIGHIHSHNIMKTFFSGTDMDELKENCFSHVNYLSVIVNNFGDITGKMVMVSQVETKLELPIKGSKTFLSLKENLKQNILVVKNCEFPTENSHINADFEKRFEKINSKKVYSTTPNFPVRNITDTKPNFQNTFQQQNTFQTPQNFLDFNDDEVFEEKAKELFIKVLKGFYKKNSKKNIEWDIVKETLFTIYKKYADKDSILSKIKDGLATTPVTGVERSVVIDSLWDLVFKFTNEFLEFESLEGDFVIYNDEEFDFFLGRILNIISNE